MEETRVRICDIAEKLGLSTATVSNVIHGNSKKASPKTAKHVMELLEERQYIPHMAGVLLARNASSRIIGVFVNDHEKYEGHTLKDFFISSSLNHLSTEIEKSGQFMMVKKAKRAEDILEFASMWNMDGIVVIGFCEQDYMYLRSRMRIPFVIYDGFCRDPERIVNISIDNYDGGYQVGRHFAELGHRRALCIADNRVGVDLDRIAGFYEGFASGKVEFLSIPMGKDARWQFYLEKLPLIRSVSAIYGRMGTDASAAMTLTNPIQSLMTGALCGLSQASGIIIGKKLGNDEYDDACVAAKRLIFYGLIGSAAVERNTSCSST